MGTKANMWENDRGFLWMLAISLLSLASSQVSVGFVGEGKFLVRLGFFLFTLIAIKSSSLPAVGKTIGYVISSTLFLLAILLIWFETQSLLLVYSVLATSYMTYIIALVVSQIFTGEVITVYKIGGSVAVYVLLGQLWSSVYLTIYILDPAAFLLGGEVIQNEDALKHLSYFSFITLTTIGFGDIVAINSVARLFAMMEGLMGQLFPAIFIAKLVSLQIGSARNNQKS